MPKSNANLAVFINNVKEKRQDYVIRKKYKGSTQLQND